MVCKNKKWGKAETLNPRALCAAETQLKQPTADVHTGSTGATQTLAVADTGVMVCEAGPKLFKELRLYKKILTKCGNLKDIADRYIEVWGYYIAMPYPAEWSPILPKYLLYSNSQEMISITGGMYVSNSN